MRNRTEYRQKLSDRGRRAAEARWSAYHASIPRPDYRERPDNMYRLTWENLMTGETNIITFHPGPRQNNYRIQVNGRPWKTGGFTAAIRLIQKSCYRRTS